LWCCVLRSKITAQERYCKGDIGNEIVLWFTLSPKMLFILRYKTHLYDWYIVKQKRQISASHSEEEHVEHYGQGNIDLEWSKYNQRIT
jgi:hypothetical protein